MIIAIRVIGAIIVVLIVIASIVSFVIIVILTSVGILPTTIRGVMHDIVVTFGVTCCYCN